MKTQGEYGVYGGKVYELNVVDVDECYLVSSDKLEINNGFDIVTKSGTYLKSIEYSDLSYIYEINAIVVYDGVEFMASYIENGEVMLYYMGAYEIAAKYDMKMYDRCVYFKYVPLTTVEYIAQTWTPYKRYIDQVSKSVVKDGLIELEGTRVIYNEREYGYIEVSKEECYIVSNNPIDIYNGFDEFEANRYRKLIMKDTVTFIFHKSSIAYYNDKQYIVKSITGNQIKLYDNDEVQEVHILDIEKIVSTWNHV